VEPCVAWVEEQSRDGDGRLLGSFTARAERDVHASERVEIERVTDLGVDAAISWARARAGLVVVRFGRREEYWSAGATPHWGYPSWPPPDLPPLIERPAPARSWITEPPGEPVYWAVTFWLTPPDLSAADDLSVRETWDIAIALSAASSRLRWDATSLQSHLADKLRARADHDDGGYLTMWSPEYRVYLIEKADNAASAERQAGTRFVPPAGFASRMTTRPADLSDV
jgi:hypothetical protein